MNLITFQIASKEFLQFRGKATFWFGGILSLLEQLSPEDTNISLPERIELLKILTQTLADATCFYKDDLPASLYRLLSAARYLTDSQSVNADFESMRVSYLGCLMVYAITTGQYFLARQTCSEIAQLVAQSDSISEEVLVTVLCNYLSFHQKGSNFPEEYFEMAELLKKSYAKLLRNKKTEDGRIENVLIGVFKQQSHLLIQFQEQLSNLLQLKSKLVKKISPEQLIDFAYTRKIANKTTSKIKLKLEELKFYTSILRKFKKTAPKQQKLEKLEAMLEKSLDLLNEQKETIQNKFLMTQRKESQESKESPSKELTDSKLSHSYAMTKQTRRSPMRNYKLSKESVQVKPMKFKMQGMLIEASEDGLLFCDYTRQHRTFVDWDCLSQVMHTVQMQFCFQDYLKIPASCYYDFLLMLRFYLSQKNKQVCILSKPLALLEINQMVKIYAQQGKFVKVALMNQYDPDKLVGVIDCFIQEFDQFFRPICEDGFMNHLAMALEKVPEQTANEPYNVHALRRNRETTSQQLESQLPVSMLEYIMDGKDGVYKCVVILKNNAKMLLKIIDSPGKIHLQFIDLMNDSYIYHQSKVIRSLEVPLSTLTHYFPIQQLPVSSYLCLYSRMLVDCLTEFPVEGINASLEIMTYASKTEMMEYGKYYTPVSAELVGSKQQVWALIIRNYELTLMEEQITVLANPYRGFLKGMGQLSGKERKELLEMLLINAKVTDTYAWLESHNQISTRASLHEYLITTMLIS